MFVKYLALAVLTISAVVSDAATYKIKNLIHMIFITLSIVYHVYQYGMRGLAISVLAIIIPILLLFPLFALRMLGAGDIKLFASIGSIMGIWFVLNTIVYSFLCGGVIALILIIIRKNAGERIKYFLTYLKSCFLCFSLLPYSEFFDKTDGGKFRFSYAIASGVVVSIYIVI